MVKLMAYYYITDEKQCDLHLTILHVNRQTKKSYLGQIFIFLVNFFPPT